MLKNMISLNVYDGRKCKIKKISHVSRRSNCRHEVFQRGLRLLTHLRIYHDLIKISLLKTLDQRLL